MNIVAYKLLFSEFVVFHQTNFQTNVSYRDEWYLKCIYKLEKYFTQKLYINNIWNKYYMWFGAAV